MSSIIQQIQPSVRNQIPDPLSICLLLNFTIIDYPPPIDDYEYNVLPVITNHKVILPSNSKIESITPTILGVRNPSNDSFIPLNHMFPILYPNPEFKNKLESIAVNNTVIITFIDGKFSEALKTFYHTSIKRLNITNFITIVDSEESRKVFDNIFIVTILDSERERRN